MPTFEQDLSQGNYEACFEVAATLVAAPKRTANSALTALVKYVSLLDSTGAPFGTDTNPIYIDTETIADPATATVTSLAATATSAQVLAANTGRLGFYLFNTGTAGTVYLLYGAGTASSSNLTVAIAPGTGFAPGQNFRGAMQAVWSTLISAGPLAITELTA